MIPAKWANGYMLEDGMCNAGTQKRSAAFGVLFHSPSDELSATSNAANSCSMANAQISLSFIVPCPEDFLSYECYSLKNKTPFIGVKTCSNSFLKAWWQFEVILYFVLQSVLFSWFHLVVSGFFFLFVFFFSLLIFISVDFKILSLLGLFFHLMKARSSLISNSTIHHRESGKELSE